MAIWNERIHEKRLEKGITLAQVADKLGVAEATAQRYESGNIKNVPYDHMCAYGELLGCSPAYLMGWENEEGLLLYGRLMSASAEQMHTILKEFKNSDESRIINGLSLNLVQLNKDGLTQVVSYTNDLLKIADYRKHSLTKAEIINLKSQMSTRTSNKKKKYLYTYMQKIACAGTGFYFDDIPTDLIEAPYMPNADFIIGVNGDSMEPTYCDGDKVYVEKRQLVEVGDIGIFMVDNECFIKEAGKDGLISHNPKYDIIPGSKNVICIGKVLGKVEQISK